MAQTNFIQSHDASQTNPKSQSNREADSEDQTLTWYVFLCNISNERATSNEWKTARLTVCSDNPLIPHHVDVSDARRKRGRKGHREDESEEMYSATMCLHAMWNELQNASRGGTLALLFEARVGTASEEWVRAGFLGEQRLLFIAHVFVCLFIFNCVSAPLPNAHISHTSEQRATGTMDPSVYSAFLINNT